MHSFYGRFIEKENDYYRSLCPGKPVDVELSPIELNDALNWLIGGSSAIVDFGCGSGALAFLCALRGVNEVLGIDLAEEGIRIAQGCAKYVPQCHFTHGSIEILRTIPEHYFDGVILSNILDNMRPADAMTALAESIRILKPGGKVLVKLNPYLSQEQIEKWNIAVIEGDLLDDGLLLWNKDDFFWQVLLQRSFSKVCRKDVYYPEYDKTERLFCCVK